MKYLLLFCLLIPILNVEAQTAKVQEVGKIEYYEGTVELGKESMWMKAKIDMPVNLGQSIRTVGDANAEIKWKDGKTSFVGPASKVEISALKEGLASNAASKTQGSFSSFKAIFDKTQSTKQSQEGGIRRTEDEVREKPAKDEIYWKQDEEIEFDEAFALYEQGDYKKAITALRAFLHQKPEDAQAKYAWFAMGHSYIMSNNTVIAKEIFDNFIKNYPEGVLAEEARKIRSVL